MTDPCGLGRERAEFLRTIGIAGFAYSRAGGHRSPRYGAANGAARVSGHTGDGYVYDSRRSPTGASVSGRAGGHAITSSRRPTSAFGAALFIPDRALLAFTTV